jgi:hypothetical protein
MQQFPSQILTYVRGSGQLFVHKEIVRLNPKKTGPSGVRYRIAVRTGISYWLIGDPLLDLLVSIQKA